jgi:hypothetical protein
MGSVKAQTMTESEWLACSDRLLMLEFLQGKASERKLRLFACACCRAFWSFLTDSRSREAIEAAERYADGAITRQELRRVGSRAGNVTLSRRSHAAMMTTSVPLLHAEQASYWIPEDVSIWLVRDFFGNPFRPVVLHPAWLTSTVSLLAHAAHDDRVLPAGTLDATRLCILADALEEAGCDNDDILTHLRGPGLHVRGCWVVDLCMKKG